MAARRKKSKLMGFLIMGACGFAGAWFHKPILDKAHDMGLFKKHA